MKNRILLIGAILITNLITAQQIKFEDIKLGGDIKGQYTSYLCSDGFEYKIGDTIYFGKPSGLNGYFQQIVSMDIAGTTYPVNYAAVMNRGFEIKKIKVWGTKKLGLKVNFQTKGMSSVDNYFFNIEDAIQVGEIEPKGMTSDKALNELKKAKEKLDLGLITQEDYDKLKIELSKYIK